MKENSKKDRALEALLSAESITRACEIAGISRKTMYNYLNIDTDFLTAYRDMRRQQLRETSNKLGEAAETAVSYLISLVKNDHVSDKIRLTTASKLIEFSNKYRDYETKINSAIFMTSNPLDAFIEKNKGGI